MDEREQRKGTPPVLSRRCVCVCVCDGVQLCTHQHQTCTHRSVDGNIKYKKKLKNTKGKKGKNAAAPADDVRVRALSENKLKAVWYITYGGLLMAVRELLFPHPPAHTAKKDRQTKMWASSGAIIFVYRTNK